MTDIDIFIADRCLAPQIAALENLCFAHPWSEESVKSAMESGTVYLCARKGDDVLGFAGVKPVVDEGQVANIAVHPAHRGQGLGRRLAVRMAEYCRELGCATVTLEVRRSNLPARKLYLSVGFCEVGVRKNYYRDPVEDGILMTLTIGGDDNE